MKKRTLIVLSAIIMLALTMPALLAQGAEEQTSNKSVSTRHSSVIRGRKIDYTATAGTITVEEGESKCELFYIAYTRDDVDNPDERPITFAFNGGPGASSTYINFLCLGPKIMETDAIGHSENLPGRIIDNYNSLLDVTDLVFIDAVETGYSYTDDNLKDFIGYWNDVVTTGDFILKYLNSHDRFGSPLYIAGESYGTTRAVGVCKYLEADYSIGVRGLILLSSINDFMYYVSGDGNNDLPFAMFTPTYAADAWYHGCVEQKYLDMSLEDYLDLVCTFVRDEYYPALFSGRGLSDGKKDEIAGKYASLTGLSKEYVLSCNLRIKSNDFFDKLLEKQNMRVGRYDGRFSGQKTDSSIMDGSGDPSSFDLDLPLRAAVNNHISKDLAYQTDRNYIPYSSDVNFGWSFDSDNLFFSQERMIQDLLSKNSKLKIWVLCGYYDGATPFFGAENVFNHVFVNESREDSISFSYYPAGHMFYLDKSSFDSFRLEAEKWYRN